MAMKDAVPTPAARRVSDVLLVLAAALVAAAVPMAILEGPLDAVLFLLLFAAPAVALAFAIRRPRHPGVTRAGALLLAAGYALVVAGNWSGYDARARVVVPLLCGPLVVTYLAAFLVEMRAPGRASPGGTTSGARPA